MLLKQLDSIGQCMRHFGRVKKKPEDSQGRNTLGKDHQVSWKMDSMKNDMWIPIFNYKKNLMFQFHFFCELPEDFSCVIMLFDMSYCSVLTEFSMNLSPQNLICLFLFVSVSKYGIIKLGIF